MGFHCFESQLQRVDDLVRDLVTGQPQHLAGIFLFAGLLEEGVGRAEAQKLLRAASRCRSSHSDDRRAEAADQRMLLDGRDQLEAREGLA